MAALSSSSGERREAELAFEAVKGFVAEADLGGVVTDIGRVVVEGLE